MPKRTRKTLDDLRSIEKRKSVAAQLRSHGQPLDWALFHSTKEEIEALGGLGFALSAGLVARMLRYAVAVERVEVEKMVLDVFEMGPGGFEMDRRDWKAMGPVLLDLIRNHEYVDPEAAFRIIDPGQLKRLKHHERDADPFPELSREDFRFMAAVERESAEKPVEIVREVVVEKRVEVPVPGPERIVEKVVEVPGPERVVYRPAKAGHVEREVLVDRLSWQDAEWLGKLADTLLTALREEQGQVGWPRQLARDVAHELTKLVARNREGDQAANGERVALPRSK